MRPVFAFTKYESGTQIFFHGPAAAECDGVIQTVVQSLVGPLFSKKYVDCEILMGKEENSNSAVKDISQLHGLKLGKRITSKQRPNALLTMKTQFFSVLIAFRFLQQVDLLMNAKNIFEHRPRTSFQCNYAPC